MANAITLATRMDGIIDDIYKQGSVTSGIDTAIRPSFGGVSEVSVLKVSSTGLGDYNRATGYPKGNVTATWETIKLEEERGAELTVDRMDDEETLNRTFGAVVGTFSRDNVNPELDAYRFAKYASTTNISAATPAVILTKADVIAAIDEASRQMDADEVPMEGRRLFVNSNLKPILNDAIARQWTSEGAINTQLSGYNGMVITYVNPNRFYTAITLQTGASSWGYVKATAATSINFLMIDPNSILQVVKWAQSKVFDPDVNQSLDSWLFQYRLYHDAYVYDNKVKGVYLHASTV